MADIANNIEAGKRLRDVREAKLLTQRDVEQITSNRYGPEHRVQPQMISRIEKGQFDKPPIEALLKLGQVYGLNPDQIAQMYKLWEPDKPVEPVPTPAAPVEPRLRRVLQELPELPKDLQEDILSWLDFALTQALAKQRAREKEREATRVS